MVAQETPSSRQTTPFHGPGSFAVGSVTPNLGVERLRIFTGSVVSVSMKVLTHPQTFSKQNIFKRLSITTFPNNQRFRKVSLF